MTEYTELTGTCPDPQQVLNAAYAQMAEMVRDFVCTQAKASKEYTDSNLADLQAQLSALGNTEELTSRFAAIEAFLDSLDSDGDGSIDELLAIKDIAVNALAVANTANVNSDEAKKACIKVAQDLVNFQATVSSTLSVVQSTIADLESQLSTLNVEYTELRGDVDKNTSTIGQLESVTSGQATDISQIKAEISKLEQGPSASEIAQYLEEGECRVYSKMYTGFQSALIAFKTEMDKGCDIYSDNTTTTEATGDGAVL